MTSWRKLPWLFWVHALLIQRGETCLVALSSGLVWRNVQRTTESNIAYFIPPIVSMSLDFDPMWEEIACQALTLER